MEEMGEMVAWYPWSTRTERRPGNGGVVYTRWGKSTCPRVSGTTLVYAGRAGRAGGTFHGHNGGAVNYLCMLMIQTISLVA